MSFLRIAKSSLRKMKGVGDAIWLAYPSRVECNACGWRGRHFLSDAWQEHINCPRCQASIRHRLFVASLQHINDFSMATLLRNKRLLHVAPEPVISRLIRDRCGRYVAADFLRGDCDLTLDLTHMPQVADESFDIVIAFDVLEHVPNYQRALAEIHRVLVSSGYGIFTVPQKDDLALTFEDPNLVTAEDREKNYGQWDHLRIFGDDFPAIVAEKGFQVTAVNESHFPPKMILRHVLFPPRLSNHPLATNYRKVFFAQKISPKQK